MASMVVQLVKNLPAIQETQVLSLGQEDPLEEEMATPPVFLPGEPHGQRSLVSYSPHGGKSQTRLSDSPTNDYTDLCQQSDVPAFEYAV